MSTHYTLSPEQVQILKAALDHHFAVNIHMQPVSQEEYEATEDLIEVLNHAIHGHAKQVITVTYED